MRTARLFGDLGLLEQGVEVAVGFGVRPLEGLLGVAELIRSSVYQVGSLSVGPDGLSFTLLNPPLRMGAFSSVRLTVDGVPVPPSDGRLGARGSELRRFDSIDRDHPIALPIGEPTDFLVALETPLAGRRHVRLELQSVAIPPLVWMEFEDEVASARSSP